MTTNKNTAISIEPWLSVRNGARAVEFYISAFGATEVFHLESADGGVGRLEQIYSASKSIFDSSQGWNLPISRRLSFL